MSRGRVVTAIVALCLLIGALSYRIVDVQATPDERILHDVSIPLAELVVPAARGMILDRNGRTIALSLPVATLVSDPSSIEDPAAVAAALSEVLGVPPEDLLGDLEGDRAFRYVVRQIDRETGDRVQDLGIEGIRVIAEPKRKHPNGNCSALAAVGRVNIDHEGMSGIEETHDEHLAGVAGRMLKEVGVDGTTIPGGLEEVTEAIAGKDIIVTLDRNVQFQAERLMIEEVAGAGASSGVAVVSIPATGEIVAIANVARGSNGIVDCTRHNLAATWSYEPGSAFKPVTAAAALSSGQVTPETAVEVPSHITIVGHRFEDTPNHGPVRWTPTEIISRSSNLGTITMARRVGEARLYQTMRALGFGERTALRLKGETKAILPPVARWNGLSLSNMALGQGLAVTPLQMVQAYNAIANGGVLVPLRLIAHDIEPADGGGPLPEQALDAETAAALLEMLTTAVEEGTGQRAQVEGYSMAGKTGTAWQPCDVGYDCVNEDNEFIGRHYTATFAGIVSNDDGPALVVLVAIDEPKGDRFYGGQLAAPAAAKIAEYALRQLRIPAQSDIEPGERRRAEPAPHPDPAEADEDEPGAAAGPARATGE